MNILDLSPEDFESSLKELDLGAEREQFLRDEYAKKNTLSGQTLEAFQEATAVPEGKERAMIAPMTKPEGMSGLEAIRSGEAELAVPGFLTGAVEGVGQALTTGEKVTKGIAVTEEELQQAAETGASLGMANVPKAMARGYDPAIVPIFGGPNAKKFPTARAEGARLSKKSPDEIWQETGVEFITDEFGTRPIFQIDPKGAKVADPMDIDPELKAKLRRSRDAEVAVPLKELLDFPELYENYPVLKDFQVNFQGNRADGGNFSAKNQLINVGMSTLNNPKRLRELLLHELQHGVQAVEGTPGGSSVSFMLSQDPTTGEFRTKLKDPEWEAEVDRLNFIGRRAANSGYDTPEWKEYERAYKNIYLEAYKKYMTNSGEIEARAAELWDELSSGEKATTRPSNVYREALRLYPKEAVGNHTMPTARLQNYAKGGMVEDNQMKKLFQEGGMTDDGMNVEPVTGNEIPPGSLAEEVRDDIPAQLSQGEYVVPADVVRFFGVRFFEDLRREAKQGLSQMDADGRIGGTPVDSNGIPMGGEDDALTPEEEAALMEALGATGMAQGGMAMPNFQQPMSNPYENQAMLYQPPQAKGNTGMAEGGLLSQTFTGFESRRYINPETKEERVIQFLDGRPLGSIPAGFVPWTAELAAQPIETPAVETPEGMGGSDRDSRDEETQGGSGGSGYQSWAENNYDAITSDPLAFGREALQSNIGELGKGALQVGAALNPALGLVGGIAMQGNNIRNIAAANAALELAKAQGLDTTELEKDIAKAVGGLPDRLQKMYEDGKIATGKNYLEALSGLTGERIVTDRTSQGTATAFDKGVQYELTGVSDKSDDPTMDKGDGPAYSGSTAVGSTAPSTSQRPQPNPNRSSGGSSARTTTGGNTRTNTGGGSGAPARTTTTSAPRTETYEEKMKRGGGFQKGGLVAKPTKKTKKPNKGLAG